MNVIMTLVIGAVIGWLASMMMKTNNQMGSIANIVVGIVGAWLGGVLAGVVGMTATSMVGSIIVSVVGASVLIAILKALNIFK